MHPQDKPDYWQQACTELSQADPVMAGIIKTYQGETLTCRGDAFHTLARSIVGQQISVKAADAVWGKLEAAASGAINAEFINKSSDEALRACGLSRQKITYLNEIATYCLKGHAHHPFEEMSDDEVIASLTEIKGVGRWTAEMFLIFHLMRSDVFPVDDIGLQKGIERHYASKTRENAKSDSKKAYYAHLREFSAIWQPWRTVVTWYLWRSLDPVPVAY